MIEDPGSFSGIRSSAKPARGAREKADVVGDLVEGDRERSQRPGELDQSVMCTLEGELVGSVIKGGRVNMPCRIWAIDATAYQFLLAKIAKSGLTYRGIFRAAIPAYAAIPSRHRTRQLRQALSLALESA